MLFPYLDNKEKASKLLIDDDSIHFISVREYAQKITDIIKYHLSQLKIDADKTIITDATAGVGGNTISFGMSFKSVNAIEIDKKRTDYLVNNLDIYNLKNVNVINGDCTQLIIILDNHDVIFVDPPWGGKNYKKHDYLRLHLSDMPIEMICNGLLDEEVSLRPPSIVVFKLPSNYDIKFFYDNVKSDKIYFHDLKKMILLVVINPKINKIVEVPNLEFSSISSSSSSDQSDFQEQNHVD
jgi:16S rRNA G966 N2-methylase RsmD